MAKFYNDPDVGRITFPDDATPQEMEEVIQQRKRAVGQPTSVTPQPAQTQTKTKNDSYFGELYNNEIKPLKQLPSALAQIQDQAPGWMKYVPGALGVNLVYQVGKGLLGNSLNRANQAYNDASQGHPIDAIAHSLSTFPGLGELLGKGYDNANEGNYRSAAQDMTSLLGSIYAPKVVDKALSPVRNAGVEMYQRGLKFPKWVSDEDQQKAAQLGVDLRINQSKNARGALQSYIDPRQAEKDQLTQSLAQQGVEVPLDTITQPLVDRFRLGMRTNVPSATNPQELIDALREYHSTLPPGSRPTPGNSNPGVPFDLVRTQKESTDKWIRDVTSESRAWGENSPTPAGILPNKLLANGERAGLNAASPRFGQLNDEVSNALTLQSRLQDLAKTHPNYFEDVWKAILATGAGAAIYPQHFAQFGPAMAAAVLTREAMRNPAIMGRVAIALGNAGKGGLMKSLSNAPKVSLLPSLGSETLNNQ